MDIQTGYDPGSCSKKERGLLKLIKDRSNNDKLLICNERNGVYVWKTTDGNAPSVMCFKSFETICVVVFELQREHPF